MIKSLIFSIRIRTWLIIWHSRIILTNKSHSNKCSHNNLNRKKFHNSRKQDIIIIKIQLHKINNTSNLKLLMQNKVYNSRHKNNILSIIKLLFNNNSNIKINNLSQNLKINKNKYNNLNPKSPSNKFFKKKLSLK